MNSLEVMAIYRDLTLETALREVEAPSPAYKEAVKLFMQEYGLIADPDSWVYYELGRDWRACEFEQNFSLRPHIELMLTREDTAPGIIGRLGPILKMLPRFRVHRIWEVDPNSAGFIIQPFRSEGQPGVIVSKKASQNWMVERPVFRWSRDLLDIRFTNTLEEALGWVLKGP